MVRRGVAWTAAAVAVAWLLAGCVKMDMDIKIRSDNKVDGTVILAVDEAVITSTGLGVQNFRKQLETQGPFSGSGRPTQGSVSHHPYDSGGRIGETYTFSGVPLTEFGGKNSGLTIERKGDRFFVSGVIDLVGSSPTDPQGEALAKRLGKSAETRIRMTFPGEVLHSNGKIDGRSVTWHPKLGEKTPLTAEARTTAVFPVFIAVGSGVGLLLLVTGGLLLFFFFRRRREVAATAVGYPADPYDLSPPGAATEMTMPLPVVPPAVGTPPPAPQPAGTAEPTQVIRTSEALRPVAPDSTEESS